MAEKQKSLFPENFPVPERRVFAVEEHGELPGPEKIQGPEPDKAFLDSIRRVGVLQNVALVKMRNGNGYTVAFGRRRIKAARAVGQPIPANIYPHGTNVKHIMAVQENLHRSTNVVTDLQAIEQFIKQGHSEQWIAQELGMNLNTVRKRLKLSRLIPDLRRKLEQGKLAVSTAYQVARLKDSEQEQLASLEKIRQQDVREVKAAKAQAAVASLPEAMFAPQVMDEPGNDDEFVEKVVALMQQYGMLSIQVNIRTMPAGVSLIRKRQGVE